MMDQGTLEDDVRRGRRQAGRCGIALLEGDVGESGGRLARGIDHRLREVDAGDGARAELVPCPGVDAAAATDVGDAPAGRFDDPADGCLTAGVGLPAGIGPPIRSGTKIDRHGAIVDRAAAISNICFSLQPYLLHMAASSAATKRSSSASVL
jgi:hypothetical protein